MSLELNPKEVYNEVNNNVEEADQLLNEALDELKQISNQGSVVKGDTMDELRAQARRQTAEFNGNMTVFRSAFSKLILAEKIVGALEKLNPFKK